VKAIRGPISFPSKETTGLTLEDGLFAEVYALYYDLDDSRRANLPPDVVNWFDNNIGNSEGGNNDLKPIHTSISSSRKSKR
jgi:hypothetical protein